MIIVLAAAEAMAIPWRCASRPPDRQPVRARHSPSGPLEQTRYTLVIMCVRWGWPTLITPRSTLFECLLSQWPKKQSVWCGVVAIRMKMNMPMCAIRASSSCSSRKHGKKEPQSFVHCGSFDEFDLQSLNDCMFFLFYDCNFIILGAYNIPLKRCFQDLSNGISKAAEFLKLQLINQK